MMANYSHPRKHTHHTTGTVHKYCITFSLTPAQERVIGATTLHFQLIPVCSSPQ